MKKKYIGLVLALMVVCIGSIQLLVRTSLDSLNDFPINQSPQAQDYPISDPIRISNNSDIAFYATEGDGLSWETAYIISSKIITCNDSQHAISIQNSSRYIIFRNLTINLVNVSRYNTSIAVFVNNSHHIRFEFATITFDYINSNGWTRANKSYFFMENVSDIVISNSAFVNLRHTGITIKNGLNISISANFFSGSGSHSTELGWGVESFNSTNLLVTNSVFSSLISGLDCEKSDNILITGCQFTINYSQVSYGRALSYSEGVNITVTNNLFDGYSIFMSDCVDAIIEKNKFYHNSWTQTILTIYSSNQVRFNNNLIWHCRGSVFKMYDSQDIFLSKNVILGIGESLYHPNSSLKPISWNLILPNLTWIFVGLGLMSILLIIAQYMPYQRDHILKTHLFHKKYESLKKVEVPKDNSLKDEEKMMYTELLTKLTDFNRKSTRNFRVNMLFLLGIIFPFSLRYMVHPDSNILLDLFSHSFDNPWAFFLDSIVWYLIKWGVVVLWLYDIGRKMKRQHIWPPITIQKQKKRKKLGLVLMIFTIWWYFTYISVILFYPPVIVVDLGILFGLLHLYFKLEIPENINYSLLTIGIFATGLGILDLFLEILNSYPYSFNSTTIYLEVAIIFIVGSIFYKITNIYNS